MGEQQTSTDPTRPDYGVPTLLRQEELERAYEANVSAGKNPYTGVAIRTMGELQWILRERKWLGSVRRGGGPISRPLLLSPRRQDKVMSAEDLALRTQRQRHDRRTMTQLEEVLRYEFASDRPNLSEANLTLTNLSGVDLTGVNLHGAILNGANLSGANLERADLSAAHLWNADMRDTNLYRANLEDAHLWLANLTRATFYGANLTGAHLQEADLGATDLQGVHLDSTTELSGARLDTYTTLGDIVWNGAQLTQIDWQRLPVLADERLIRNATNRKERIDLLRYAARSYRGLAIALRAQGLLIPASTYRLREQKLERRALLLEGKLFASFGLLLLDWVAGYGERPARAFRTYAVVVLAFAAFYYLLTNMGTAFLATSSTKLQWYEAMVLSVSSFHGRGFFPQTLSLGDPVAIAAAAEAIIGLFVELIFIATFTQRFFAR